MPTYLDMYLSISKKFGKDSPQLEKYKSLLVRYFENKKVVYRYYKRIMEGER